MAEASEPPPEPSPPTAESYPRAAAEAARPSSEPPPAEAAAVGFEPATERWFEDDEEDDSPVGWDEPGAASEDRLLEAAFVARAVSDPRLAIPRHILDDVQEEERDGDGVPANGDAAHVDEVPAAVFEVLHGVPPLPVSPPQSDGLEIAASKAGIELTPVASDPSALQPAPAADDGMVIERNEAPSPVASEPPPATAAEVALELGPKSRLCIGIDLGTTNSCAALVQDGKAKVMPSRRGGLTIPSVVGVDAEGKVLVGEPAVRQLATNPKNTIVGGKRLLGRSFRWQAIDEVRSHFAYEIVEHESGDAAVLLGGDVWQIEDVAATILRELREGVSLQLHEDVNRAVITCPAYFQERQRQAVRAAGEKAGLHVERILNEPTAAALNYGFGRSLSQRRILIYDLGGGTFDASLMEVEADVYEVLATGGDTFLGGIDFDDRMARLLVREIKKKYDLDPREDESALGRLMIAAERAKRDLTDHHSTIVRLDYFVVGDSPPTTIEIPFERVTVEKYFDPLVERTLAACEDVCARAKIKPDDVDDVILVGGQSRSPIIRRKVREFFGQEPRREVHPDEAVALGAAQYAHSLGTFDSLVLIDALPMSIGVGLPGGRFKKIVERDTKLPVSHTYTIRTSKDDQRELLVMVFQGEQDVVMKNEPVGTLKVPQLPKGPKGSVAVEVTFEISGEALLNLKAKVQGTDREVATQFVTRATPEETIKALKVKQRENGDEADADDTDDKSQSGGFWGWLKRIFGGGEDQTSV